MDRLRDDSRVIVDANSFNISMFLYEEVVCQHGCPRRIVMDGGKENMNMTKDLLEDYRIQNTVISPYHHQTAAY